MAKDITNIIQQKEEDIKEETEEIIGWASMKMVKINQ